MRTKMQTYNVSEELNPRKFNKFAFAINSQLRNNQMKRISLIYIFIVTAHIIGGATNNQSIFSTSKCFDLFAIIQNFDNIKNDAHFSQLSSDTVFTSAISQVNQSVRTSNICNLYNIIGSDKNELDSALAFARNLHILAADMANEKWVSNILYVQPQLEFVVNSIVSSGYSDYWDNNVYPRMLEAINNYHIESAILDSIHAAITNFAGRDNLPSMHSKTYIIDIDNAFNLADESFCSTPLLLNPEIEKQVGIDFIKVYIHENIHRLPISSELSNKLHELMADDFYKRNEEVAVSHHEGGNEAFVIAVEAFISHRLGRRDYKSVYDQFVNYVDGSLVLAPIIYVNLCNKLPNESLNDFILRLFAEGKIKVGEIESQYNSAMALLQCEANNMKQ